ncbi:hypothetical protein RFI_29995, partial [Reticulomyxa filosa]
LAIGCSNIKKKKGPCRKKMEGAMKTQSKTTETLSVRVFGDSSANISFPSHSSREMQTSCSIFTPTCCKRSHAETTINVSETTEAKCEFAFSELSKNIETILTLGQFETQSTNQYQVLHLNVKQYPIQLLSGNKQLLIRNFVECITPFPINATQMLAHAICATESAFPNASPQICCPFSYKCNKNKEFDVFIELIEKLYFDQALDSKHLWFLLEKVGYGQDPLVQKILCSRTHPEQHAEVKSFFDKWIYVIERHWNESVFKRVTGELLGMISNKNAVQLNVHCIV